jgi:transposase
MKHPPYSPDLPPSDYYLFPKLKKHLRGRHCSRMMPERTGEGIFELYWKNVLLISSLHLKFSIFIFGPCSTYNTFFFGWTTSDTNLS